MIRVLERHVPVQTRGQVPQVGHGQHHGHPEDQALRGGHRGATFVGIRGSPAQARQGRRAQGAEAAIRGVRAHVQGETQLHNNLHRYTFLFRVRVQRAIELTSCE